MPAKLCLIRTKKERCVNEKVESNGKNYARLDRCYLYVGVKTSKP